MPTRHISRTVFEQSRFAQTQTCNRDISAVGLLNTSENRIVRRIQMVCLLCALSLYFCSCSTVGQQLVTSRTLGGDSRLPSALIEPLLAHEKWSKLKNLEYEAFFEMKASIDSSGSISNIKLVDSYPDTTRYELAHSLIKNVKFSAKNTGSHIDASATVWVIFFKSDFIDIGNLVLVLVHQSESADPGSPANGVYLDIRRY